MLLINFSFLILLLFNSIVYTSLILTQKKPGSKFLAPTSCVKELGKRIKFSESQTLLKTYFIELF